MGGAEGAVVEGIGVAVAGTGAGVATSTYMSTCDMPKRTGTGSVTNLCVQEKRAGPGRGEAKLQGFLTVSKILRAGGKRGFPSPLAPPSPHPPASGFRLRRWR